MRRNNIYFIVPCRKISLSYKIKAPTHSRSKTQQIWSTKERTNELPALVIHLLYEGCQWRSFSLWALQHDTRLQPFLFEGKCLFMLTKTVSSNNLDSFRSRGVPGRPGSSPGRVMWVQFQSGPFAAGHSLSLPCPSRSLHLSPSNKSRNVNKGAFPSC